MQEFLKEVSKLHIGQSAVGWQGLLKINKEHYTTVGEMKDFYERNKERLVIVNQYGETITWETLNALLLARKGWRRGKIDSDGYCWKEGEFS